MFEHRCDATLGQFVVAALTVMGGHWGVGQTPGWNDWGVTDRVTVFLLDDHEIVRRGVRDLLEAEDDLVVVGEASTEDEAVRRIPALDPDVAVLDVRLQDGDGITACREIRSRHPRTACLMLTSFADDEALFHAIMAGAAGYVLKQIRSTDLVDAVRRVAAGQQLLDPAVTARVMERLRKGPEEDELIARLSPQERQVLVLLADGLTNRQIAERLYLAEKTIKNYVTSVLSKMGMTRRTEAAVYAARHLDPPLRRRRERGRSALAGWVTSRHRRLHERRQRRPASAHPRRVPAPAAHRQRRAYRPVAPGIADHPAGSLRAQRRRPHHHPNHCRHHVGHHDRRGRGGVRGRRTTRRGSILRGASSSTVWRGTRIRFALVIPAGSTSPSAWTR